MSDRRGNRGRNRKKGQNRRRNKKRFEPLNGVVEEGVPVLVNRLKTFFPPRLRTTLRYNNSGIIVNVGVTYGNGRLCPTNAYDIDPVLGSTSMPGFIELSGLYRRYRVNWYRHTVTFANKESFPLVIYVCPANNDPGANTTGYQAFLSNRSCKSMVIGPLTGNGTGKLVSQESWESFSGLGRVMADDDTTALVNAAPPNNMWSLYGFFTGGASVSANGVVVNSLLEVNLDMYELQSPAA